MITLKITEGKTQDKEKTLNKELQILLLSSQEHINSGKIRLADHTLNLFLDLYPTEHISYSDLMKSISGLETWYAKNREYLEEVLNGNRHLEKMDAEQRIMEIGYEYVLDKLKICYTIFTKYKLGENEIDEYTP